MHVTTTVATRRAHASLGVSWLRVVACVGCAALGLGAHSPVIAREPGADWPLRSSSSVLLAFGESYRTCAGAVATHRGLDLRASAGDEVLAACAGSVSFVGRVPAEGGGTRLAATIERVDGVRLTFMPLESCALAAGGSVDAGDAVGVLADKGDASCAEPHLHVGARRGDLYVDPAQFLSVPAPGARAGDPAAGVETGEGAGESVQAPVTSGPARSDGTADEAPFAGASGLAPRAASRTSPLGTTRSAPVPAAAEGANALARAGADGSAGEPVEVGSATEAPQSASNPAGSPQVGAAAHVSVIAHPLDGPAQSSAVRGGEIGSVIARGVAVARRAAARLARGWLMALFGMLTAAGALWPLWRREDQVSESGVCSTPGEAGFAAAAGR